MPQPARALALAIASLMALSVPPPADAAPRKKAATAQVAQARQGGRPASRPRARPAARQARAPAVPATRAAQLERLYADYWNASMQFNPLQATFQGDPRYNDQLPNFLSAAWRTQSHAFTTEWLGKVEKIGSQGLQGQDLLSYEMFVRDARASLAAETHPAWMQPISQYYNLGSIMAILGSGAGAQPFNTVQDYDNWSRRSLGIPPLFDQAIANMREGVKAGVVQPRDLMEKVLPQLDAVIKPTAEESIFWSPIRTMPASINEADRARLSAEYKRMIELRLMPAYRALRGFIATEYLPATRTTAGMGALPGGQAWYAQVLAQSTATDLPPMRLHAWAAQRVQGLDAQITTVMKEQRIRGNQAKLLRSLREDRRYQFSDANALLGRYRQVQQDVAAKLPAVLDTLPAAPLEIQPVDAERAMNSPAVSYQVSAAAGRPAVLSVNTNDLPSRRRWSVPMQYLHEGVPGHHVQLGLQQALETLPRFRRQGGDAAFVEGWGLYAESLGDELGVYTDPYDRIGYLHAALVRAARVVADTGLHADNWSKQRAVTYLQDTAGMVPADAVAEVERMMAQPGQALSNVLGEARIVQLRDRARQAQGGAFDARRFHAELLKDGSMPLDILDAKMTRWLQQPATK